MRSPLRQREGHHGALADAVGQQRLSVAQRETHKRGRDEEHGDAVESGRVDAAFFMRATPVEQVQEVAEAGESMPPKSTYFFPKLLTGLVFNPLSGDAAG